MEADVLIVGAGLFGRLGHGALLDLGDARRHRDHDTDAAEGHLAPKAARLADEVGQHVLRDLEVGDHEYPLWWRQGGDSV